MSVRKPNRVSLLLLNDVKPSKLSQPSLLRAFYDDGVISEARAIVTSGFSAGDFGVPVARLRQQFYGVPFSLTASSLMPNVRPSKLVKPFLLQAFSDESLIVEMTYISMSSIENTALIGVANIWLKNSHVGAAGFSSTQYGHANTSKPPQILPIGIDALRTSEPLVENKNRYIVASSGAHSLYGNEAKVILRTRWTYPAGWDSSALPQEVMISHFLRWLEAKSLDSQAYGTPWVSHSPRKVGPESIFFEFSSSHMLGQHSTIESHGFVATLFGKTIRPIDEVLYPQGFIGGIGTAFVQLKKRYVNPKGFLGVGLQPADMWGWHTAYNLTQYVTQNFINDSGLVPPKWSDWQSIENRNKIIGVIGFNSEKHGYTNIENNARLLEARGIASLQCGKLMTAYRIRAMVTESINPYPVNAWGVVYNSGRVVLPVGFDASKYGEPSIETNRRYLERIGNFESMAVGKPMISDRIRTISIEPRYSIAPPVIRLPTIDLWTRGVSFNGFETAAYGQPALTIHFNIIAPKWIHRDNPGFPALKNLTPELFIRGHDSNEFGVSSIRTQWRTVEARGDRATLFGVARVSDTKQSIDVAGWLVITISQQHKFVRTGTKPYTLQNVWLNDESGANGGEGYGIWFDSRILGRQVPIPAINQNVLLPTGFSSSRIGVPSLWSSTLEVTPPYWGEVVSRSLTVSNKVRHITLTDKNAIPSRIAIGWPILSPQTIWAVKEAPSQAMRIHQPGGLHYVGEYDGKQPGYHIGVPKIESTIRSVYPQSFESSIYRMGYHSLNLRKRVIKPEPFRLSRFGLPSIPFTERNVTMREGVNASVFGILRINQAPVPYTQYAGVGGIYSLGFGVIKTENFIRFVNPNGVLMTAMGSSRYNDSPHMWQSLRVGEHVPLVIGGYDSLRTGATTVWHKIRGIDPIGFDAFSSGYELSNFRDRMTVSNAMKPEDVVSQIIAAGRKDSAIGQHGIKLGQHFIRPDGNSEQFRKGAW